jgi:uridylate kinase
LKAAYGRLLLKLSGEALGGESGTGISPAVLSSMADEIREVHALGVQVSIVIGGGNVIRGMTAANQGMDRANADYMGMLASVINGMALQDALERTGLPTRMLTAIDIAQIAEPYIRRRALRHLEKGRIVIFGGGTGNPYFSTDTAAALRAAEIHADVVMKATKVDGVYSSDPETNADAVRYDRLSYSDAIRQGLAFMDQAALALCRENRLPLVVFNMNVRGNIQKAVLGESVGTLVEPD